MEESLTLIPLLLQALKRVPVQAIFDQDRYESRRDALPGSQLLWVLVAYQLIKSRRGQGSDLRKCGATGQYRGV